MRNDIIRRSLAALALPALVAGACPACNIIDLFTGGGGDDGGETKCTDESTDERCPPAFSDAPEGAASPPSLEETLARDAVAESGTLTVSGTGEDRLSLGGGLLVTVPAGALPAGAKVSAYRYPFDEGPEGSGEAVYRLTSSEPPAADVTVVFPVPGDGAVPIDAADVVVAFFDGVGHARIVDGTVDAAAGTVTVATRRLSPAVVTRHVAVAAAASADRVTRVPFYGEEGTESCWSVALAMLLAAYAEGIEPWDNAAFFGLAAEHGLPFTPFRHSQKIAGHVGRWVAGAKVERQTWWTGLGEGEKLRRYLVRNMTMGRPTLLWEGASAHMVLVVGIEGDTFIVNDPAAAAPYERRSWARIEEKLGGDPSAPDGAATLALTEPFAAPGTAWSASIEIPHASGRYRGVVFAARKEDGKGYEEGSSRAFSWHLDATESAGLKSIATGLEGTVGGLDHGFFNVAVANIMEGGESRVFKVGYEIRDAAGAVVAAESPATVTLAAGQFKAVDIIGDRQGGLRMGSAVKKSGDYTLTVFIAEGTRRQDSATIAFGAELACGDGACDGEGGEDSATCPADCGEATCDRDGECEKDEGETVTGCEADCHCGNGICDHCVGETASSCAVDCAGSRCGNGICELDAGEYDAVRGCVCAWDCGTCGDGTCYPWEYGVCAADCCRGARCMDCDEWGFFEVTTNSDACCSGPRRECLSGY